MPRIFLNPRGDPIPRIYIILFPHFVTFQFLSALTFLFRIHSISFRGFFLSSASGLRRINYSCRTTMKNVSRTTCEKRPPSEECLFIINRSNSGGSIREGMEIFCPANKLLKYTFDRWNSGRPVRFAVRKGGIMQRVRQKGTTLFRPAEMLHVSTIY